MLKLPEILTVRYHGMDVGKLSMSPDNRHCVFEYDRNWLSNGFPISPLEMPLMKGLLVPKTRNFFGNFAIFEDSVPDGYGNYLLERILKKYKMSLTQMNPVERLSLVGTGGMGALEYIPEVKIDSAAGSMTFEQIQQDALAALSEKDITTMDTLFIISGNSGGCRPKCLWEDEDGRWLIKFRHVYDPKDIGVCEYNILQAAKECGITVPETKLFNEKYLGTKRFDVAEDGTKLHVATASGLLCESIRQPMMDYKNLIRFTGYLTRDPIQSQEMFRRMIFNYAIDNNDDHAKNFSFVYENDKWRISPAYDITECREANNGFHASLANGKEKPTEDDFLSIASDAGLTKNQANEIISDIFYIVKKLHKGKGV